MLIQKNTASQKWRVYAFNRTTGAPVTGDAANITGKISKDHAALGSITDTNPTEVESGYYDFDLTQTETNADTLSIVPVSATSEVVVIGDPPSLRTAQLGLNNTLAVDTTAISGDATAADNAELAFDGTGYAFTNCTIPWNSAWDAEVQSEVADALAVFFTSSAQLVDDIWDEATAGHVTASTFGKAIADILADTNEIQGDLVDGGRLDLIFDSTLADTNELQGDWTDGGRLDLILDAILVDTAEIGTAGAGLTAVPWNSSWDAEVQSEVDDALTAYNAVATTDLPTNFADLSISATTGLVDLVADQSAVTIGTVTDVSNGVTLDAAEDVYWADIEFNDDDGNSQDEYSITWHKNDSVITSGITSPLIQVIKRVDGTDLVASTAMTQIGSTGSYKYTESTNRITDGESVLVKISATIDASTRTDQRPLGRDSTV